MTWPDIPIDLRDRRLWVYCFEKVERQQFWIVSNFQPLRDR